jgi:hypothetical protein
VRAWRAGDRRATQPRSICCRNSGTQNYEIHTPALVKMSR